MAYCVYCGTEAKQNDRFCVACGREIATPTMRNSRGAMAAQPERKPVHKHAWFWAVLVCVFMTATITLNTVVVSNMMRAALDANTKAIASAYGGGPSYGGEEYGEEAYNEGDEDAEDPYAPDQAEPDPTDTSVGAFERGDWGMSLQEVKDLETDRIVEDDGASGDSSLYYDYYEDIYGGEGENNTVTVGLEGIYDYHVEATYKFDDDKLYMGQYTMTRQYSDEAGENENFTRMRDFMIARYGEEYQECEIWYDGGRIDKPSEYEEAFEEGELERCMYWTLEDRIVVFLYSTGLQGIDYPSVIVLVTPNDEGNREYYGSFFEYYTDITAPQLSRAFTETEVAAAKRRFVDRMLYVTGAVKSIDAAKGIVVLKGDKSAGDVDCTFADPTIAAQLSVGDLVGVIGACEGRKIGQDHVSLGACQLDRTEPVYDDVPGLRV